MNVTCRPWPRVTGHPQNTKAGEEVKAYLQGFCEGSGAGITDFVAFKVELIDGGVCLSKNESEDTVI